MLKIKEAIVVEGRYDKNALSQAVDAVIIETRGFGVFSDEETVTLLRRLADRQGLIILTDSDGAGFVIRNRLKGCLPPDKVKHAYIPDIAGKEKRKKSPSKEGTLGVEGMSPQVLIDVLRRAGATFGDGEEEIPSKLITKADLYALGLSGGQGSAKKRAELLRQLDLPAKLPANSLVDVLNALMSREEFYGLF